VTVVPPELVIAWVDHGDMDGLWTSRPQSGLPAAAAGPVPDAVDPAAVGTGTGTTVDDAAVGAGEAGCWPVSATGTAAAAGVGSGVGLVVGVGVSVHAAVGLEAAGRGGATTARPTGTVVGPVAG
jgi:hypothetical protein